MKAELLVDRLRDLISRENLVAGAIRSGRQADRKQKDRPVPIENLRAQDQKQDCAAQARVTQRRKPDGRGDGAPVASGLAGLTP